MLGKVGKFRVGCMAVALTFAVSGTASAGVTTELVSVGPNGVPANDESDWPSISADGGSVAFSSLATNLVSGDTNGHRDIFVHDRSKATTTRVSGPSCPPRQFCPQSNGDSEQPRVSAGGRYVAFESDATNLVPGDTNGRTDVFVRDRITGKTTRESKGPSGQGNHDSTVASVSQDGRIVVFESLASNLVPKDSNGTSDIFVRDRKMGTTTRVSAHCISGGICIGGNDYSARASISADGRFVAFESEATNLVPGDTNGKQDLFVFDRKTNTITRENMGPLGIQANDDSYQARLSADGRFLAFSSHATVLTPGDTNGKGDSFVRDRQTGTTTRVSVSGSGVQGNDQSIYPTVSTDGRFVAFFSFATKLVPGDTNGQPDAFVRDRTLGTTTRASVGQFGLQGNSATFVPEISADGHSVAFESFSDDLVISGGTGIFVHTISP